MDRSRSTKDAKNKIIPKYDLYKNPNYFSDTLRTNFIYGTCCWIGTYVVLYCVITYCVYTIGTISTCNTGCCTNNDYMGHFIASLLCSLPLTYVCVNLFDEIITKFIVMICSALFEYGDSNKEKLDEKLKIIS